MSAAGVVHGATTTGPAPRRSAANVALTVTAPQDRTRRDGSPVAENSAYAAMLSRMVRSYERRLGTGDVEDLAAAVALREQLDAAIAGAITIGRAADPEGWSWARIGRVVGITRQAAQQRWSVRQPKPAGIVLVPELVEVAS